MLYTPHLNTTMYFLNNQFLYFFGNVLNFFLKLPIHPILVHSLVYVLNFENSTHNYSLFLIFV